MSPIFLARCLEEMVVIETTDSILCFIWRSWVAGFQDPDLVYCFARPVITKYQTERFKQQKCICSNYGGWKSEIKMSTRVFLLRPLSLAYTWSSSPCIFISSSLCVCLCPNLFYKNTCHIGLGPTLMTSSNLITSLKALSPSTVTFWGTGGLGLRHTNLGWEWGHNSVPNI